MGDVPTVDFTAVAEKMAYFQQCHNTQYPVNDYVLESTEKELIALAGVKTLKEVYVLLSTPHLPLAGIDYGIEAHKLTKTTHLISAYVGQSNDWLVNIYNVTNLIAQVFDGRPTRADSKPSEDFYKNIDVHWAPNDDRGTMFTVPMMGTLYSFDLANITKSDFVLDSINPYSDMRDVMYADDTGVTNERHHGLYLQFHLKEAVN